jgi:hypothetical protein
MAFQTLYLISKLVFFADDSSIIVTNHSPTEFTNDINKVFGSIMTGLELICPH